MNKQIVSICIAVSVLLHALLFFYLGSTVPAVEESGKSWAHYTTATFRPAPPSSLSEKKITNKPAPEKKAVTTTHTNTRSAKDETASLGGYFEKFNYQRSRLIRELERKKVYPSAARQPGKEIQGSVSLRISIDNNGNLISLQTIKSSGSSILDWAAKELVNKVVPFRHNLGSRFTCEVSIGYWLKN